jgi:hypothetical protein
MGTQQMAERPPVPKRDYPWLAYMTFAFEGRPIPTQEEFDRFDEISVRLEDIERTGVLAHVAIMTIDGKRDYISYCRDREGAAKLLMEGFSHEGAQIEFQFDPGWSQFSDLRAITRA